MDPVTVLHGAIGGARQRTVRAEGSGRDGLGEKKDDHQAAGSPLLPNLVTARAPQPPTDGASPATMHQWAWPAAMSGGLAWLWGGGAVEAAAAPMVRESNKHATVHAGEFSAYHGNEANERQQKGAKINSTVIRNVETVQNDHPAPKPACDRSNDGLIGLSVVVRLVGAVDPDERPKKTASSVAQAEAPSARAGGRDTVESRVVGQAARRRTIAKAQRGANVVVVIMRHLTVVLGDLFPRDAPNPCIGVRASHTRNGASERDRTVADDGCRRAREGARKGVGMGRADLPSRPAVMPGNARASDVPDEANPAGGGNPSAPTTIHRTCMCSGARGARQGVGGPRQVARVTAGRVAGAASR